MQNLPLSVSITENDLISLHRMGEECKNRKSNMFASAIAEAAASDNPLERLTALHTLTDPVTHARICPSDREDQLAYAIKSARDAQAKLPATSRSLNPITVEG